MTEKAMLLQKFVRRLLDKVHQRKLKEMQQSFLFFDGMKLQMQTESQIKIASAFRRHLERKQKQEEIERLEQERRKSSALKKRSAQNTTKKVVGNVAGNKY